MPYPYLVSTSLYLRQFNQCHFPWFFCIALLSRQFNNCHISWLSFIAVFLEKVKSLLRPLVILYYSGFETVQSLPYPLGFFWFLLQWCIFKIILSIQYPLVMCILWLFNHCHILCLFRIPFISTQFNHCHYPWLFNVSVFFR